MSEIHPSRYLPGMGHRWLTPLYDPVTRLLGIRSQHRMLVEQADVPARGSVLEIGCGTGNLAVLAQRTHPAATVVGIDPDPSAVRIAQRKAARARLDVGFEVGFAERLPYADASFDRVLSAMMLHHLDPEQQRLALREARRVLAPHGSLHLVDLGGGGAPTHGFIARRLARASHSHGDDAEQLHTVLDDAGFTEVAEVAHRASHLIGRTTFYRAQP